MSTVNHMNPKEAIHNNDITYRRDLFISSLENEKETSELEMKRSVGYMSL